MIKTAFFGTPEFALESFLATLQNSELLACVTQPDRPRGRGHELSPCPVKALAQQNKIPVFDPASLRKPSADKDTFFKFFKEHPVDLFVVTAYGNLLPDDVLALPRLGSINVHASLLPRWRGAAPIQRALEAGDKTTGVCLQKMVAELDAGDVISQKSHPISNDETALELSGALSKLGGQLVVEFFKDLDPAVGLQGQAQDVGHVTWAKKIDKSEALFNDQWTAVEFHNRVRAFRAWPIVKFKLTKTGQELKILRSALGTYEGPRLVAGQIQAFKNRVFLGCRDNPGGPSAVELVEVQAPGKGPVKAWDFFQNIPI